MPGPAESETLLLDLLKSYGIGGLAVLVSYYLVRDVLSPLVKMARRKSAPPPVVPLPLPGDNKLQVLELNFKEMSTKVTSFEALLEQSGSAMDEKLDIVLADNKDFRDLLMEELRKLRDTVTQGQKEMGEKFAAVNERIKGAETHLEHLLKGQKTR